MRGKAAGRAKPPLVSVVIPAYNCERYIAEAIDSVLAQTLQDFEIIVVDDGSSDGTAEVIAHYGGRVRSLRQDHRGAAAARNLGIREAEGAFVAFLDADDLWLPTKLEKQLAAMSRRTDLGMTFTGHLLLDEGGLRASKRGSDKRSRLLSGDPVRNIFLHSGLGTPTVMVRKSIFDQVGLFDEDLPIAEDDNLWMRIAAACPIELLDECLSVVRLHATSTSADKERLLAAIRRGVHLARSRYPELASRLADLVPKRLAMLQFSMGCHYFSLRNYAAARGAFAEGARHGHWRWRNRSMQWFCSLPAPVIDRLRALRGRAGLGPGAGSGTS